ncbi:hypothetical protein BKA63DRAFT_487133 [Paraphoma chrysanthemicola]|nr:hypothetical protein BKA63DRAFT_487133 [Paraphoma chrysanthemicola]
MTYRTTPSQTWSSAGCTPHEQDWPPDFGGRRTWTAVNAGLQIGASPTEIRACAGDELRDCPGCSASVKKKLGWERGRRKDALSAGLVTPKSQLPTDEITTPTSISSPASFSHSFRALTDVHTNAITFSAFKPTLLPPYSASSTFPRGTLPSDLLVPSPVNFS